MQFALIALCVWIGVEFYLFMQWGMSAGENPFFARPPGVEGFLPISALISLKYSPYNKVAEVKKYLFFADISKFALWAIFILVLLSIAIKNLQSICGIFSILILLYINTIAGKRRRMNRAERIKIRFEFQ